LGLVFASVVFGRCVGIAGTHGTAGEFTWAGFADTYFWAEPKKQICAVYMKQAPSPMRAY
jgi:hypothetical protein